jgi:hypothetical protein
MSTNSPTTKLNTSLLNYFGRWTALLYILSIVVVMGYTGWISFYEASTRYMLPFVDGQAMAHMQQNALITRANPTLENMSKVSHELTVLSRLTSAEHFSQSKLFEHGLYYLKMPILNKIMLLVHIYLATFCMLFGAFQFWPQFRKRFMKLHRKIGMLYIVTAPLSVTASLFYMALTAPQNIYDHFTGYVALWVFGLLSIFSIVKAMIALKNRRIYEHQAYMALSFGCLLLAPMLRWNWVILAWIFPHIDQETLNLVTLEFMVSEVLLIAYGLILINRQYVRPMRQRLPQPIAAMTSQLFIRYSPVFYALALGIFGMNIFHYVIGNGIASMDVAHKLVPLAVIQHEGSVMQANEMTRMIFGLTVSLAIFLAIYLFKNLLVMTHQTVDRSTQKNTMISFVVLTSVAAMSSIKLGWVIGIAPNLIWLSGGAMYTVVGFLLLAFITFFALTSLSNQYALAKENLVFLLCLLPFTALFYLNLWIIQWLPLPQSYLDAGQAHELATGASSILLVVAMFYVIYGQATREHA